MKTFINMLRDQGGASAAEYALIIAIIGVFGVMELPYIMTNGGPADATKFIALYVYQNAFQFVRMGYASAMAWIQLLIVLTLTAIAFWSSRRWVHYQGAAR